MQSFKYSLATAIAGTALPTIAFAQSASPTFLHENRMAIALIVVAYLAPSIIAFYRKQRSLGSIIAVNVLLGWSLLGWVWAFIWSLGATKQDVVIVNPPSVAATPQNASAASPVANKPVSECIAELKAMLDAGTITESEFQLLKADALKGLA